VTASPPGRSSGGRTTAAGSSPAVVEPSTTAGTTTSTGGRCRSPPDRQVLLSRTSSTPRATHCRTRTGGAVRKRGGRPRRGSGTRSSSPAQVVRAELAGAGPGDARERGAGGLARHRGGRKTGTRAGRIAGNGPSEKEGGGNDRAEGGRAIASAALVLSQALGALAPAVAYASTGTMRVTTETERRRGLPLVRERLRQPAGLHHPRRTTPRGRRSPGGTTRARPRASCPTRTRWRTWYTAWRLATRSALSRRRRTGEHQRVGEDMQGAGRRVLPLRHQGRAARLGTRATGRHHRRDPRLVRARDAGRPIRRSPGTAMRASSRAPGEDALWHSVHASNGSGTIAATDLRIQGKSSSHYILIPGGQSRGRVTVTKASSEPRGDRRQRQLLARGRRTYTVFSDEACTQARGSRRSSPRERRHGSAVEGCAPGATGRGRPSPRGTTRSRPT
jgi:hypothetical protein